MPRLVPPPPHVAELRAAAVLLCVLLGTGPVCSQPGPFPFQDPALPWHRRLDDLLGRLSPAEMVLQVRGGWDSPGPSRDLPGALPLSIAGPQVARGGAMGNGPAPPIPRLGIGPYNWNTECLRGDAEAPGWATAFPQALGLAATFRYRHRGWEPTARTPRDGSPRSGTRGMGHLGSTWNMALQDGTPRDALPRRMGPPCPAAPNIPTLSSAAPSSSTGWPTPLPPR